MYVQRYENGCTSDNTKYRLSAWKKKMCNLVRLGSEMK